jgi:hypothetical protein
VQTSAYDALSADLLDSPIYLPTHLRWNNFSGMPSYYWQFIFLRCASHTLNLISSVDIEILNFDYKSFP